MATQCRCQSSCRSPGPASTQPHRRDPPAENEPAQQQTNDQSDGSPNLNIAILKNVQLCTVVEFLHRRLLLAFGRAYEAGITWASRALGV